MPTEKTPTSDSRRLGEKIRKAREATGISLRDFAKTAGVSFSTLSRLESGLIYRPSASVLKRLSRELNLALEELYALAGYARPEGLPELKVYLRRKYGVSADAAARMQKYFEELRKREAKARRHGGRRNGKPTH